MFQHVPVMLQETLDALALQAGNVAVDTTVGGGGHLWHMAKQVGETGQVIGFDQDPRAHDEDAALSVGRDFGTRVRFAHSAFSHISDVLRTMGVGKVDALLCDLGISSPQVDESSRGFSFLRDGPLDMRMNTQSSETAYDLIQASTEKELADILYNFGEEYKSRRIARAIKAADPLPNSTLALAEIVARALGGRRGKTHPATKTFQALRIAVNRELDELDSLLAQLPQVLGQGGRAVFIAYHSLEDRRIKHAFRNGTNWKLLNKKVITPSDEEIKLNPRSRSAKLRAIQMVNADEMRVKNDYTKN